MAAQRTPWLTRTGVLLLLCALAYLMFRRFEHSLVFFPHRELQASPQDVGLAFEDVHFKSADGTALHGWFFPSQTNSPRANLVVLICHGNAGNVSHRLGLCQAWLETGVNVFVFDYRGYGLSEGRPSELGTYHDAQGAHAWLLDKHFRPEDIIAFGESLGGGVAAELALREQIGGLILQSTFTSIPDAGAELYPWLPVRLISTIKYDTVKKLPRIHVPLLIIHSRTDELVRFHHAEQLFKSANEPKHFCELTGGHNDAAWEQPKFRTAIGGFLKGIEGR